MNNAEGTLIEYTFMTTAYALISPANVLLLDTTRKEYITAERMLKAEFPPGHIIYPDHRVVKFRISEIEVISLETK